MVTKAIIYYTDNNLEDTLGPMVREKLLKSSEGIPIICVSQKPIDFGKNICVGEIGRSHLSMYKQILVGCQATTADVVYMAEHDCLYTPEHFQWTPPTERIFYYNLNAWFVNMRRNTENQGMYFSPWGIRHANSQLVCYRKLLIENLTERIEKLETGWTIRRGIRGACEAGVAEDIAFIRQHDDGIPYDKKWVGKWKAETFKTVLANLDIRHNRNLTGWRRGHKVCGKLPYWGEFKEIIDAS